MSKCNVKSYLQSELHWLSRDSRHLSFPDRYEVFYFTYENTLQENEINLTTSSMNFDMKFSKGVETLILHTKMDEISWITELNHQFNFSWTIYLVSYVHVSTASTKFYMIKFRRIIAYWLQLTKIIRTVWSLSKSKSCLLLDVRRRLICCVTW